LAESLFYRERAKRAALGGSQERGFRMSTDSQKRGEGTTRFSFLALGTPDRGKPTRGDGADIVRQSPHAVEGGLQEG